MELTYTFAIKAGDRAEVSFGAQSQTEAGGEPVSEEGGNESGPSPIFGILGGLLLLGGLGLGWYAFQQRKPASRFKGGGYFKK